MATDYEKNTRILDSIAQERVKNYLNNRVLKQMTFYSENSEKNRKMYYRFSVFSIAFNAVIPVVVLFSDFELLSFAAKFIVAVLSS